MAGEDMVSRVEVNQLVQAAYTGSSNHYKHLYERASLDFDGQNAYIRGMEAELANVKVALSQKGHELTPAAAQL